MLNNDADAVVAFANFDDDDDDLDDDCDDDECSH